MKHLALFTLLVGLVVGCQFHIAPLPPGAKACASDWDCPDGMSCRFPGVDTRAQCMGGGDARWEMGDPPHNFGN